MNTSPLSSKRIIFFDGVCHLCNGFVDAVIRRDSKRRFLFAPLQGSTATELLPPAELQSFDTVIYFENGKVYHRSDAILKVLTGLGSLYGIFALAWLIPRPGRDFLYKLIAKNRYSWFGQREFCRLALPEERSYLLP